MTSVLSSSSALFGICVDGKVICFLSCVTDTLPQEDFVVEFEGVNDELILVMSSVFEGNWLCVNSFFLLLQ